MDSQVLRYEVRTGKRGDRPGQSLLQYVAVQVDGPEGLGNWTEMLLWESPNGCERGVMRATDKGVALDNYGLNPRIMLEPLFKKMYPNHSLYDLFDEGLIDTHLLS